MNDTQSSFPTGEARLGLLSNRCRSALSALAVGLTLVTASPLVAQQVHPAAAAHAQGDHAKAFALAKQSAERGDVPGLIILGKLYMAGHGVDKDYLRAADAFAQAADLGSVNAQHALAGLYLSGRGVTKDRTKAMRLYLTAAAQGHKKAQLTLDKIKKVAAAQIKEGYRHATGNGVPQDFDKALEFFTKATEYSDIDGLANLSVVYRLGLAGQHDNARADELSAQAQDLRAIAKGPAKAKEQPSEQDIAKAQHELGLQHLPRGSAAKDLIKARKHFEAAAKLNYPPAFEKLGWMYRRGKGVRKDMHKAAEYYLRGAELGHVLSQITVASIYQEGRGIKANYAISEKWYRVLAEDGNPHAMAGLSTLYRKGHGVPQNDDLATEWLVKSAENGSTFSMLDLAMNYELGRGVTKSLPEALKWYRLAAEKGGSSAKYNLGRMYENGIGVEQSYAEAINWYEQTTGTGAGGHPEAQFNLGMIYLQGLGVPKNDTKAAQRFERAAKGGHASAMYNLAVLIMNERGVPKDVKKADRLFFKAAGRGNVHAKEVVKEIKQRRKRAKARQLTPGQELLGMIFMKVITANSAPMGSPQQQADFDREQAHIKAQQDSTMAHVGASLLLLP